MTNPVGNSNIPNEPGYSLSGKKKLSNEQQRVIEAIKRIHQTIGWDDTDDRISIKRYQEDINRSVFAISKEGDIVGYATAKPTGDNEYYLSFIAVDQEKQSKGVGTALLIRVLEKVKKKGGKIVTLDFEDEANRRNFYMNDKIPYKKVLEEHVGKFRTGKIKSIVKYDLTEDQSSK